MKRKICVVTGTRAEYGILYWLMQAIVEDHSLELQVLVTGMHLSPEFGLTYKLIEQDGFVINEKVEMLLSSDTAVGITKSVGLATIGIADALDRLKPDILVVLGDRYEILAAAQAAMLAKIPIAHISGGETTEGAVDEGIRHAVTKMAHLHFVAADPYRKRVMQLGEDPQFVFNVGDPGLDNITRLELLSREELEKSIDFALTDTFFLVTYHPVTLGEEKPEVCMRHLLDALDAFPDAQILFTKPNSDAGGRIIARMIDEYAACHQERVFVSTSLGQLRYLSALKHCSIVIGNSSSGIVEAPPLYIPTVNVGNRQRGRLRAGSIIDCEENREDITKAICTALSAEFQAKLRHVQSVYGMGNASYEIKQVLKAVKLAGILNKKFYDIDYH
jgi:UDP-hydrolysing UDP-N-acetyl-D-glucosamine 2-epimerase